MHNSYDRKKVKLLIDLTIIHVVWSRVANQQKNYHDNPEHNSSYSCESLEEPVADGGLVIRIKVELIGQAVQVLNWLGGDMVKVNLENEM